MREGGNGVIHMGLLNVIRRMALREQLPKGEIARRTGLSRNTGRVQDTCKKWSQGLVEG